MERMARTPKQITQMRKLIYKIKLACPNIEYLEHLEEWINWGVWSWPPRLKEVPAEKINRCGDVLSGPIYSCKGYEWPMHKELPMVPFIQLDLSRCSRVSGIDFGTGLLQVWFGVDQFMGNDAFIRVVPRDYVDKERLLTVPAEIENLEMVNATPAFADWVGGKASEKAIQIVGYKPRRFTIPHTYTFKEQYAREIRKLDANCQSMIKELDILIEYAQERFSTGLHLMGTFEEIQYSPSEYQDKSETPFFCFDGEESECFNFGDGNGQLFFKKDVYGRAAFSLDWTCF
jgi:hypothetical protein